VWFNEYLRVFDIEHSLFASLSELTDTPFILAIDRPVGSEPFSLSDTERLRPIGLHLSQAIKMFRQFQVLNNGIQAHEHYLDTLNRGIVSVNLKGKLLYANAFAMDVLIRQEGLTVRNGLLCGVNEEGDMALAAMLALAKQGVGQAFALARSPSSPPLKIQSVPMAGDKTAMDVLPECEAGKVLLLFSVESVLPANAYQCFAKVHRLTCQETKVLQGIVEGYVLKEIAERHAVSVNTVRSQLASLMQKTYCKRQKDLVRLFFCATNPRS
ncbi:MAG: LuxR family transcriptional regulator, partial [Methylovulum sp.]